MTSSPLILTYPLLWMSAASAVGQALSVSHLAWRRQPHGHRMLFSARKGAMQFSMWLRIVLGLEERAGSGTAMVGWRSADDTDRAGPAQKTHRKQTHARPYPDEEDEQSARRT